MITKGRKFGFFHYPFVTGFFLLLSTGKKAWILLVKFSASQVALSAYTKQFLFFCNLKFWTKDAETGLHTQNFTRVSMADGRYQLQQWKLQCRR